MEFDNTFTVAAPLDEVWTAMLDIERVASCVPGAQVLEQTADNAYKVAIKIKLGPVSMTYKGDVEVVSQDEATHHATMKARAKEARGQGTADAAVEMALSGDGSSTAGTIHTDVALSGKAAAMGQGVIADVSARIVDTFAANLATMLAGGGAGEAAVPAPGEAAVPAPGEAAAPQSAPPPSPGSPPPRAAPPPPPPAADALPIGSVVGGVLAERLRDPRTAAAAFGAVALVAFLLGRLSRRR